MKFNKICNTPYGQMVSNHSLPRHVKNKMRMDEFYKTKFMINLQKRVDIVKGKLSPVCFKIYGKGCNGVKPFDQYAKLNSSTSSVSSIFSFNSRVTEVKSSLTEKYEIEQIEKNNFDRVIPPNSFHTLFQRYDDEFCIAGCNVCDAYDDANKTWFVNVEDTNSQKNNINLQLQNDSKLQAQTESFLQVRNSKSQIENGSSLKLETQAYKKRSKVQNRHSIGIDKKQWNPSTKIKDNFSSKDIIHSSVSGRGFQKPNRYIGTSKGVLSLSNCEISSSITNMNTTSNPVKNFGIGIHCLSEVNSITSVVIELEQNEEDIISYLKTTSYSTEPKINPSFAPIDDEARSMRMKDNYNYYGNIFPTDNKNCMEDSQQKREPLFAEMGSTYTDKDETNPHFNIPYSANYLLGDQKTKNKLEDRQAKIYDHQFMRNGLKRRNKINFNEINIQKEKSPANFNKVKFHPETLHLTYDPKECIDDIAKAKISKQYQYHIYNTAQPLPRCIKSKTGPIFEPKTRKQKVMDYCNSKYDKYKQKWKQRKAFSKKKKQDHNVMDAHYMIPSGNQCYLT